MTPEGRKGAPSPQLRANATVCAMVSNPFLETAVASMQHNDLPRFLEEQRRLTAELRRLELELARARHYVGLNDQVSYYVDSPSPSQVRALEEQFANTRRDLATANDQVSTRLSSCYASCPPLEVVHRVEVVIGVALWDPQVGVEPGWSVSNSLADELTQIASRISEIWAAGVDVDAIVMLLRDDDERSAVAPRKLPKVGHPILGWAPVDHHTLLSGVAAALNSSAVASARQTLSRMEAGIELAEKRREEADAGVIERMTKWLEGGPQPEEAALLAAQESMFYEIENALGAFAPLGIAAAATAAVAALRGVRGSWESTLCPNTGALLRLRSRALRAIVLASLVELRQACERAFPGLPSLVWTGDPDLMKTGLSRSREGRYRRATRKVTHQPSTNYKSLFDDLDARGLEQVVARGVVHAARLGVIERRLSEAEEGMSWADRATFWSKSDDAETADDLSDRGAWHERVLLSIEALALRTIRQATHSHPGVQINVVILKAHLALHAVSRRYDPRTEGWLCGTWARTGLPCTAWRGPAPIWSTPFSSGSQDPASCHPPPAGSFVFTSSSIPWRSRCSRRSIAPSRPALAPPWPSESGWAASCMSHRMTSGSGTRSTFSVRATPKCAGVWCSARFNAIVCRSQASSNAPTVFSRKRSLDIRRPQLTTLFQRCSIASAGFPTVASIDTDVLSTSRRPSSY